MIYLWTVRKEIIFIKLQKVNFTIVPRTRKTNLKLEAPKVTSIIKQVKIDPNLRRNQVSGHQIVLENKYPSATLRNFKELKPLWKSCLVNQGHKAPKKNKLSLRLPLKNRKKYSVLSPLLLN